ncbi:MULTISPECIES: AbgT family transporter [unclassified Halomonas]|uniref:AbgT family transporter n=2 Tax=unclassified Halomonas TaxID=2609666 RepID=A0AAU7KGU3_9GAMM|nr:MULTISPECIES: AbgT family transporter [unclassified Halomonas]MBR9771637.1 YfcC family protein [Gammaproteobacteria bacterium]MBS8271347.1 YfcC family protein [Halomonas litopenaei]KJZ09987.1 C4-dicarboxylate ABC transporter [Halomonas sp. S2151]MAR73757.1 YfcC family protein [Halomonas sp.]MAY70472.1 YfcC family protein [Halomonas sp.]
MSAHDQTLKERKKWYRTVPDPMVLIFLILLATYALTFIIPAGEFERVMQDGRTRVVPDSFHYLSDVAAISPFDIFVAIPKGLNAASLYLFIVFIAGGLFHILQRTGALENAIGVAVNRVGVERRNVIITAGTFIYGFFGVAVGFENNIALVPIAVLIASAVGCSSLVGTTMAVGGIGVGFALSPINPYTVGVAQGIAELPTFSGAWLRALLVLTSLGLLSWYICRFVTRMDFEEPNDAKAMSKSLDEYHMSKRDKLTLVVFVGGLAAMLVGVFTQGWYINEIAGMFLLIAIVIGIVNGLSANEIVKQMMEGASGVTAGALVIGLAASIQVILKDAQIIDTIVYALSGLIQDIPGALSAIMASVVQGVINLFVPSGSGQALVTMPILVPVADLVGMSRQLMITAFQVGDGLTNLIVPTSGGTLAMLALGRVSYEKWLKAILPFMALVYLLSWGGLVIGHMVGY